MITPAVLILASGSLITTTSQRLSRVTDRVRKVAQDFMLLEKGETKESEAEEKRRIIYRILKKNVRRSKLLIRVLTLLYTSLGLFVATSLSIGVVSVIHLQYAWIPTAFGVIGALFLFFSSAILIIESRLAFAVVVDEMDFVLESSKTHAPEGSESSGRKWWRELFKL
jgi:hypothetical protein